MDRLIEIQLHSIPLFNRSKKQYDQWFESKFQKELVNLGWPNSNDKEAELKIKNDLKRLFRDRYPALHKYNDIVGYVELWLETNDILIKYFLNGDRRKKYNRDKSTRQNKNIIYEVYDSYKGAHIIKLNNDSIRNGVSATLDRIQLQCENWNVFIETNEIKTLNNLIDYSTLINLKNNALQQQL